jgi:hypothetical protein
MNLPGLALITPERVFGSAITGFAIRAKKLIINDYIGCISKWGCHCAERQRKGFLHG